MHFVSLQFILLIFFLLAVFYSVPRRFGWMALLAGSVVFYALSGPAYLIYLFTTIISAYLASAYIGGRCAARDEDMAREPEKNARKEAKAKAKRDCKRVLALFMFVNIGMLAVFKYTDFFILNLNSLMNIRGSGGNLRLPGLAAPLGISFYTFQTSGYVIDVYRERVKPEKNIFRLALFVSFFPQIIQGPISRFGDLAKSLCADRAEGLRDAAARKNIAFGAYRVLWGFLKKIVIADRLYPAITHMMKGDNPIGGAYALIAIMLYAVTIFADFTGGIDVTIGTAQMFGVKITENFNRPFHAVSLADYWRRWHITMGTWFRDYVFYPLSVSKPMLAFSKRARGVFGERIGRKLPVYVSMLSVWFLTGLWHNATWNFIVWGLVNGAALLISQELEPLYKRFNKRFAVSETVFYKAFRV
ncbi:MAG: MBOAT family protein, partial [Defluviitaleaceae bacterium]|nr:MBOAT family protein [Defluviitaleaceae bacterium]